MRLAFHNEGRSKYGSDRIGDCSWPDACRPHNRRGECVAPGAVIASNNTKARYSEPITQLRQHRPVRSRRCVEAVGWALVGQAVKLAEYGRRCGHPGQFRMSLDKMETTCVRRGNRNDPELTIVGNRRGSGNDGRGRLATRPRDLSPCSRPEK